MADDYLNPYALYPGLDPNQPRFPAQVRTSLDPNYYPTRYYSGLPEGTTLPGYSPDKNPFNLDNMALRDVQDYIAKRTTQDPEQPIQQSFDYTKMPGYENYMKAMQPPPILEPGAYHPSFLRRIGSILAGIGYGPQAEEQMLGEPYYRAMQQYQQRLGMEQNKFMFPLQMQNYVQGLQAQQAEIEKNRQQAKLYGSEALNLRRTMMPAGPLGDYYYDENGNIQYRPPPAEVGDWGHIRTLPEQELDDTSAAMFDGRTYHQLTPTEKLKVIEKSKSIGPLASYEATAQQKDKERKDLLTFQENIQKGLTAEKHTEHIEDELTAYKQKQNTMYSNRLSPVQGQISTINDAITALNMNSIALDPSAGILLIKAIAPPGSKNAQGASFRITQTEINNTAAGLTEPDKIRQWVDSWTSTGQPFFYEPWQREAFRRFMYILKEKAARKEKTIEDAQTNSQSAPDSKAAMKIESDMNVALGGIDLTDVTSDLKIPVGPDSRNVSISKIRALSPNVTEEQIRKEAEKWGDNVIK